MQRGEHTTKSKKSLWVSDLHGDLRLPHAKVNANAVSSDRLEDVVAVLQNIQAYAASHDIHDVFIVGDLFNKRHPDAPTLIKMAHALNSLAGQVNLDRGTQRRVWLLPGNHDAHDRAGQVYSIQLFNELKAPGLNVLGMYDEVILDKVHFTAIPWVPEKLFEDMIANVETDEKRKEVLLFHQTVLGAFDGGFTAAEGLDPSLFTKFDLAISGHIHKPQKIGHMGRNVVQYLGAPLMFRFGDDPPEECERGFWVLDHKSLEMDLVVHSGPVMRDWTLVGDETAPLQDVWRAARDDLKNSLLAELDTHPVYLRVILEASPEQIEEVQALAMALLATMPPALRDYQFVTRPAEEIRNTRLKSKPGTVFTTSQLARAFLEGASIEDSSFEERLAKWAEENIK